MNYQFKILKSYQSLFPNLKLREISDQTGIQMTRVFRIFNGAEMKVSEYETFDKIINSENLSNSYSKIFQNVTQYLNLLSCERLKRFNKEIIVHIQALEYKNTSSTSASIIEEAQNA